MGLNSMEESSAPTMDSCQKTAEATGADHFRSPFAQTSDASNVFDSKFDDDVTVQILRESVSPLSHSTPKFTGRSNVVHGNSYPAGKRDDGTFPYDFSTNDLLVEKEGGVDGRGTDTFSQSESKTELTLDGKENQVTGLGTVSPCDSSDSFDWRQQLSPLVLRPKRSKRRSSFGFLKRVSDSSEESVEASRGSTVEASPRSTSRGRKSLEVMADDRVALLPGGCSPPQNISNSRHGARVPSSPRLHSLRTSGGLACQQYLDTIGEDQDELENHGLFEGEAHTHKKYQGLLMENQNLRKCLQSQCYEARIAPFRHIFEAIPKLRKENEALKEENFELGNSIQQLQSQMADALQVAVEKTQRLEQELQASNSKNQEFQKQLSVHRNAAGIQ